MTRQDLGISISGGGLRSASFGLGFLQELDRQIHVLRGERCARYLAGVSGGSYTAAAVCHHLAHFDDGAGRPFAEASIEASELATTCDYFTRMGRWGLFVLGVRQIRPGFLAVTSAIMWLPLTIGVLARGDAFGGFLSRWVSSGQYQALGAAAIGYLVFVIWWLVRRNPREPTLVATLSFPVWMALLLLSFDPATDFIRNSLILRSPAWVPTELAALAALLAASTFGSAVWVWATWKRTDGPRRARVVALGAFSLLALRWTQLGWVLAAFWATAWFNAIPGWLSPTFWVQVPIGLIVGTWGGVVFFSGYADSTSLHAMYSERVASCFALPRLHPQHTDPLASKMTELSPLGDPTRDFPELLVCTAANIRSDLAPVSSFVVSPTRSFLYWDGEAYGVSTADMERFAYPTRERPTETRPMLSLFGAVGISGAALAPTMGYKSVRALTGLLAVFNARLGRWVPSPRGPYYDLLADTEGEVPIRTGIREVLREVTGFTPPNAPMVYLTDGGHYENLGIVELLRRGCTAIVCADSSLGPGTEGSALAHSLRLAELELGVSTELDLEPLRRDSSTGKLGRTYVVGTTHFSDGSLGKLVVVRLGIDDQTDPSVVASGALVRGFPRTWTLDQFYDDQKFEAYRRLGVDCTRRAMDDPLVRDLLA